MKKLFLHIGTEKTGTTTIQSNLFSNRKALEDQGFFYPLSSTQKKTGNHRLLVTAAMNYSNTDDFHQSNQLNTDYKIKTWKENFLLEFNDEIDRFMKGELPNCIISSEHFHSRLLSLEEIKRLYNILQPYFSNIDIIVYLRRQDQMAASSYSTLIKSGGTRSYMIEQKKIPYYDYRSMIDRWSTVFGENAIKIKLFDRKKLQGGDIIQDFCGSIGLDSERLTLSKVKQNPSLSKEALEFLRQFNSYVPKFINNAPNPKRENIVDILEAFYSGDKSEVRKPLRANAERFYALFREDNDWLAKKYLNQENLFNDDFSSYPENLDAPLLTLEKAIEISSNIYKMKNKSN